MTYRSPHFISELQGSAASFGPNSFAQQSTQSFGAFGGGGGGGGGGAGGNLQVECKRQEVSPGRFKFVCDGVNPNSIALRSEHILWLTGPEGQKQVVDIEVPNYKIEELIKAGFKSQPGTKFKWLLKFRALIRFRFSRRGNPYQRFAQKARAILRCAGRPGQLRCGNALRQLAVRASREDARPLPHRQGTKIKRVI